MEEQIKASELRLNNYVQDENGRIGYIKGLSPKKVTVKMEFSTLLTSYDDIEPIKLTEQWLLDFGFESEKEGEYYFELNDNFSLLVSFYNNKHTAFLQSCFYEESVNIKYIHQLQNLIFALTGEEITLKKEQ